MKAYGIFPGAAREDDLVAVVAYRWEDYRKIFGGTVDDYKDFLLRRKDFINDLFEHEVIRVIDVPWDEQYYKEWLVENIWTDEIDAHGAWALEVAKDKKQLRLLRDKYPILPAAPEDEEITAEVSYVFIPFIATSETAFKQVSQALPEEFLRKVLDSLRAEFIDFPFEMFSAKRGEGVAVVVGNRFISPNQVEDLAEEFIDRMLTLMSDMDVIERGVISVPRQMRIKQIDEYPAFTLLLLPVIFIGADQDVDYVTTKLWRDSSEGLMENAIIHLLEQFMSDVEIQGVVPIVPWYAVEDVVSEILDMITEDEEEYPNNKPNLHRIK